MKKIVVLFCSRHSNGKTSKLLLRCLSNLIADFEKFEIVKINIYNLKILFCDGCGLCFSKYGCPKNDRDDFLKVVEKIKSASCFVLASNVFFSGFPAKLKALIDRCEQFYCRKMRYATRFKNLRLKKAFLVLCAGNLDVASLKTIIRSCRQFFDCLDLSFEGGLVAPKTDYCNRFFSIEKFF